MKIRVLKELPGLKIGSVINETDVYSFVYWGHSYNIDSLIRHGWIEEVKEETLEDKIAKCTCNCGYTYKCSETATEHFKERFNKLVPFPITYGVGIDWNKLREELFK